jgi:hypothetical protein
MSRRTRRSPVKTAANPEDVLHVPALAGAAAPPEPEPEPPATLVAKAAPEPSVAAPEPFGGKGDHDQNGATGGAKKPEPSAPREKTLHELNIEARAIDRWHAQKREEARLAAREHVEPILTGILRPRPVVRRIQKSLRPLVKE